MNCPYKYTKRQFGLGQVEFAELEVEAASIIYTGSKRAGCRDPSSVLSIRQLPDSRQHLSNYQGYCVDYGESTPRV